MERKETKAHLISFLINSVAKLITPALIRDSISAGLDFLETKVINSEPTIDDKLVLPVIKAIRELLRIEEEPG
jgi:hypothetical protein